MPAGRPKGQPRTGGRQKGTPNKATAELRDIARQYTAEAVETLVKIMLKGEAEAARIAAARELLDRGHGKATQVIAGEGGGPVMTSVRVSFVPSVAQIEHD